MNSLWVELKSKVERYNARRSILGKVYLKKVKCDIGREFPMEDAAALFCLAKKYIKRGGNVLEIGSWKGNSSIILGEVCRLKNAKLTCVDTWLGSDGVKHHKEEVDRTSVFDILINNIRHFNLQNTITPARIESSRFLKETTCKYDFIFNDGDHKYKAFTNDVNGAIKKIQENGIICGHDCETMFENLNAGQKAEIHENLEIDYITINVKGERLLGVHPGVVKGVFDIFNNNYQILQCGISSGIWYSLPKGSEKLKSIDFVYNKKVQILNILRNEAQ
jgi:predicted O-methyltransferase YrrM